MDTFPAWRDEDDGFECDNNQQSMYAFACQLMCGFNLPKFDLWAASLPDCHECGKEPKCCLKQEMRERRKLALEALSANNKDAAFRHLEWMLNRQREDMRTQFLLPLAKVGDAAKKQRKKAGFHTAEQVREERKPEWDKWQQLANAKWATNPHLSVRDVAKQIAKPDEKAETIRRRIRKPS